MCLYRRVCNFYTVCQHSDPLPEELIQCDNRWCKFSTTHPAPAECPQCPTSCWQYRQYPECYKPHIQGKCPTCLRAEAQAGRR